MSITKLQSEITSLIKFFSMTGRGDLISMVTESGSDDLSNVLGAIGVGGRDTATLSTEARDQIAIVQALICDKTEGAYTTYEIIAGIGKEHMNGFGDDIEKFIKVYYEPEVDSPASQKGYTTTVMPVQDGIRSMCRSQKADEESGSRAHQPLTGPAINDSDGLKSPSRYRFPCLSAIVLPNLSLGPPTRNTDAVSLFVNGIPTVELSRCVPLINLRFVSVTTEGLSETTKQLSLLRFLGVSATGGESDKIGLNQALPNLKSTGITSGFSLETGASSAGMELFTTPQTLINADINSAEGNTSGRTTKVLDPFKPLMTLNSISVSIQGLGQEMLSSKTATVQITLHDRSRLADIAPIVAIDLFGMTSVSLEYGWSHPDGEETSDNVIGRFLNSLRSKELFNIVSSNYTMGNDGQVKITLRLAARGTTAAIMVPAATGEVIPTAIFKPMLVSALSKKLQSIDEADENKLKEIRSDIRVNLNNAGSPTSVVSRELFQTFLNTLQINDDNSIGAAEDELTEIIEKLIGSDGTGGEFMNINSSLTSAFDDKSWALNHPEATDDFIPVDTIIAEMFPAQDSSINSNRYVSLGKLIMLFVGYPLASCGRFDEVQIIFYRFNMQAGFARRLDLSQFVVDIVDLQRKLDKLKDDAPGVSISRFIQFLNSEYVDNPANPNYGLSDLYATKSAKMEEQKAYEKSIGRALDEDESKNWQLAFKQVDDRIDERLVSIYQNDDLGIATPDFTQPNLKFYIESLPQIKGDGSVDDSKTILRVHIFDRAATPHTTEMFMLSALTDSEIAAVVKDSGGAPSEMTPEVGAQMGGPGFGGGMIMVTEENIEEIAQKLNDTHYKTVVAKVSANSIKRIIKSTVPSFNFGSQFSAIKSISLSATTQGAVANTLLVSALMDTDPQTGTNTPVTMEDVKVIPAKLNVTMHGCPLIEYGQQFFVDLNTGTTADNIYGVTNLTHTLAAGKFETSFDLMFQSNGTISSMRSELARVLPRLNELRESSDTS